MLTSKNTLQDSLLVVLEDICRENNLPLRRAKIAARAMLGRHYRPSVELPTKAPMLWSKRTGEDVLLSPIQFLEKYWQTYIDEGILDQRTLRSLDNSLYEAVRIHCRHKGLDAQDYLPPPARKQKPKAPLAESTVSTLSLSTLGAR